ncbi:hypothetical protein J2795_004539 [Chryseobacterium bernardetii]|uniref:Lipoprotein n=2 Tax=Chryseobacterium TaxID=59732 RepID=A0A543EA66_9FLAO|nr:MULTISPECIES: hypothetical protein [Chryseobacterium]MDR6372005.1 hypothetical protein [Chryseobacterium vietnamense]MDR6443787.1 hypothetical protein [Chryseobacterium bernardetii]TQM18492.1 hypothetical protein FB551_4276 [Chryseobacterium aquifrigidense]
MKKIISTLFFASLIVYSCNKTKTDTSKNSVHFIEKDTAQVQKEPSTSGKQVSDFVSNQYEIQYETEGDLNQDGFPDKALVLRKKDDTLAQRTMIVLLKNPDKTYRLFKSSETVFPDEYNESGYKIHDPEDISIEKGMLNINLYDIGPYGNRFSKFKYMNDNLILTYIETYNMGAGSHSALYYEPMKGKVTLETVNTMEEAMPSETKKVQVKKERFLFENVSPDDVVTNVYNAVE